MVVELKQLGENSYLLQNKGFFALPPREIELQSIEQAQMLAGERRRVGKDARNAGITLMALGLIPLAMAVSSAYLPEIRGFHNPLFEQPRLAGIGEVTYGGALELAGGAFAYAGGKLRRNARQINAAVNNFTRKA